MASLDKLEGEAVEGIGLALLVAVLFLAWSAYKGASGLKIPSLSDILGSIQAWMNNFLNTAIDKIAPSQGTLPGNGVDTVYTGTNVGTYGQTDAGDLGASNYGPYADGGQ